MKNPLKSLLTTKRRKIAAGIAAALIAALVVGSVAGGRSEAAEISTDDTATLTSTELNSTVSYSGTVTTDTDVKVYSKETTYPIQSVNVKENDTVKAGDVLAVLDGTKLDQQIEQLEASTGVSGKTAAAQVEAARHRLDASVRALANQTNAQLVQAQSSVNAAQNQYDTAKHQYESLLNSSQEGYNSGAVQAGQALDNAEQAVTQAQLNYDQAVARRDQVNKDKQDADLDYDKYSQERDSLQKQVNDVSSQLQSEQTKKANAQADDAAIRSASQQLDAAQEMRRQARRALDRVDPSDPSYASLYAAWQQADAQVRSQQQLYDTLTEDEREYSQSRIDELTNKLSDLQFQLSEATSKRAQADATIKSYDNSILSANQAVDQAKTALDQAKLAADHAQEALESTDKNLADSIESARLAMESASTALESAQRAYAAAQESTQTEIQTYRDNLAQAEAAADLSPQEAQLGALYETKQNLVITAPTDGTVIALNADEGSYPAGSLFTIKPMHDRMVEINLKELDMTDVKLGQTATITADGAGDMAYKGRVVSIAPVSESMAAAGSSAGAMSGAMSSAAAAASGTSSSENTFKCKVEVLNADGALKPGMEANVKILLAEEKGIYAVPYNALVDAEDGSTVVYTADLINEKKQTYKARAIQVKTGLENDVSIVVEGDDLEDDMLILTNPEGITDGQTVKLVSPEEAEKDKADNNE